MSESSPPTALEAAGPDAGDPAQPSPSQEKAMSNDSGSSQSSQSNDKEVSMTTDGSTTSSTPSITQSSQSNDKEVSMTTDGSTTSSTPSNAQDGGSNGSNSTNEAAGSTPAKPPATGEEESTKIAGRFQSKRERERAEKAIEANKANTNPEVAKDMLVVQACLKAFEDKQTHVLGCVGATAKARETLAAATVQFHPTLVGALWMLRNQPNGRGFVKTLLGKNDAATTQKLIEQVPGSRYRLATSVIQELRDGLAAAQPAADALEKAEEAEAQGAKAYNEALDSLDASVSMLNGTVARLRQGKRVKVAPPPPAVLPPAPVDQPVKSSVRVTKSHAAHAKKKQD